MSFGLAQSNVIWIWVRFDGSPKHATPTMIPPGNFMLLAPPEGWTLPTDFSPFYQGGGTFQRTLQSNYEHLVLSHLANLDGHDLPGANGVKWKGDHGILFAVRYSRHGIHHLPLYRSVQERRRLGLRSDLAARAPGLGRNQV